MIKTLCLLILGSVVCMHSFALTSLDEGANVCWADEVFVDFGHDGACALEGDGSIFIEGGDGFVGSEFEDQTLEDSQAWWLVLFLGRGYIINGGNIVSRFFPLIRTYAGVHAWSGTQAVMNLVYIASMYAKLIEKAELGDPNVVNGIKGKAHIDLGKTAGFYMDLMVIALEYVRAVRLEGVSHVVATQEGEVGTWGDPLGETLDDLLVGAGWIAHLTGTSMNVASLVSKFYKVKELEERGDATEIEMEHAWKDVYVYIAKLGGGAVGLGTKLAYSTLGYNSYYGRKSAMLLSVLGSGLFLYWDMGGLF